MKEYCVETLRETILEILSNMIKKDNGIERTFTDYLSKGIQDVKKDNDELKDFLIHMFPGYMSDLKEKYDKEGINGVIVQLKIDWYDKLKNWSSRDLINFFAEEENSFPEIYKLSIWDEPI